MSDLEKLLERFWSKVDKNGPISLARPDLNLGPCWLWTAHTDRKGYGRFSVGGTLVRVHRFSWSLQHGEIPAGMQPDHLCRVPNCVNPAHLEIVTPRENILRSNGPTAKHARKTHCFRGHPFDEKNTARCKRGDRIYRGCKTCNRLKWNRIKHVANAKRRVAAKQAALEGTSGRSVERYLEDLGRGGNPA